MELELPSLTGIGSLTPLLTYECEEACLKEFFRDYATWYWHKMYDSNHRNEEFIYLSCSLLIPESRIKSWGFYSSTLAFIFE